MEPHEMTPLASDLESNERKAKYPTKRYVFDLAADDKLEGIALPDGLWTMNNNPLPTAQEIATLQEKGIALDSSGRPLHPWAHALLSSESGGAVLGKGAYWNWGPNYTADPIVITKEVRPRILLIERDSLANDELTTCYALPGGFVDGNESSLTAAIREVEEETHLQLGASEGTLVYKGPVADPRATLNAWPETTAYLFYVDEATPVEGDDDALSAQWLYIDELPETFFGSHGFLINAALEMGKPRGSLRDILQLPESDRTINEIAAGHMAYRHYTLSTDTTQLFVKEHDAQQFSDPRREAHSRAYLEKEYSLYSHLSQTGFSHIPRAVELIDDTVLAMEHLDTSTGWHWKAPRDDQLDTYISESLAAFDDLQTAPHPSRYFHETIAPSYQTFWQEGWDSIDDKVIAKLASKAPFLSENWEPEQQQAAFSLIALLPELQQKARRSSRTPYLFLAHNDARQSNLAWHPTHGVRLVDWSWADLAPKNADATMLLVDLAKSRHSVEPHLAHFNPDYALVLIGFWLAHSTWETRDGSSTVREHQLASAATAFTLLEQHFIAAY